MDAGNSYGIESLIWGADSVSAPQLSKVICNSFVPIPLFMQLLEKIIKKTMLHSLVVLDYFPNTY